MNVKLHTFYDMLEVYEKSQPLIDIVVDKVLCIVIQIKVYVTCKEGFIHDFVWFEILSSKRCMHCGQEEI